MKKDDFIKMCDRLEECNKKCKKNEIVCTKRFLKEYVNNDINKLLKIKAEASSIRYHEFISTCFGLLAFIISCFSLFISLFKEHSKALEVIVLVVIALSVLIIILLVAFREIGVYNNVSRWQKYIIVSINELEKEFSAK